MAAIIMAVFALGLLRFRVETDPQRLWVGPTSQAAQEKAAYEVRTSPTSCMAGVTWLLGSQYANS